MAKTKVLTGFTISLNYRNEIKENGLFNFIEFDNSIILIIFEL